MYEDKKDTNFLLVLFTSIIYVFIAIFVIFFIGLSKVDAALPINFADSERIRVTSGTSTVNLGTELSYCLNTWGCAIPPTQWTSATALISNYTRVDSNVANESYLFISGNNYTIEYEYSLFKTVNTNSSMKPSLAIFNSSGTWVLATCDSGQSYSSSDTYYEENEQYNTTYRQDFVYKCNRLDVTVNGNSFRTGVIASGGFTGTTRFAQYLMLTDNSRPGNSTEEIINNDNVNTDKIINNQNQNTQQIIDSVTNPDISSSNDTIGGFFGSFSDTDHGGLSGIITAPLIAFNQMLTGTCTDLSVEYEGSTTTLPCGTSFWNQISPIRDFLNITLGGLICYQIVRKLFLLIQKIKNPDDDRVEVMSL